MRPFDRVAQYRENFGIGLKLADGLCAVLTIYVVGRRFTDNPCVVSVLEEGGVGVGVRWMRTCRPAIWVAVSVYEVTWFLWFAHENIRMFRKVSRDGSSRTLRWTNKKEIWLHALRLLMEPRATI